MAHRFLQLSDLDTKAGEQFLNGAVPEDLERLRKEHLLKQREANRANLDSFLSRQSNTISESRRASSVEQREAIAEADGRRKSR